jgi:hypothetical protein
LGYGSVPFRSGYKHHETFWVKAKTRSTSQGGEEFLFTDVVHTAGPLLGNVAELFRLGHIELDYTLSEAVGVTGKPKSRDHGYLFKMWPERLLGLFPEPKKYSLLDT